MPVSRDVEALIWGGQMSDFFGFTDNVASSARGLSSIALRLSRSLPHR